MTESDSTDGGVSGATTKIADFELALSGVRNFSSLMGIVLALGVCANVYLVWLSARRRLSVRWETFRLILRYSSLVDFSMCAVLASFVAWSFVVFHHTRGASKLALRCRAFNLNSMLVYAGVITVSSGIVVAARQSTMLFAFERELTLVRQNRTRVVKLIRDLVCVGAVCFVGTISMDLFGPVAKLPMCYVKGTISSHTALLLLVPIAVSVALGVMVIAPADNAEDKEKKATHKNLSMPDDLAISAAKDVEDPSDQASDSRWNRFVVVLHVVVLTWFILAAVMASVGVLLQPISVSTFFILTGSTSLISVWSAYSMARHWT